MQHLIYGNWKSNGSLIELREFGKTWKTLTSINQQNLDVGIALPAHLLHFGSELGMSFGAQNVCEFGAGAYTGEINRDMLVETKVNFCLVGHSERRQIYGETVQSTQTKIEQLVQKNITPILCIGETLEQRKAGKLESVLNEQLEALNTFSKAVNIHVAYEPVWAIGTGVAAQPKDVKDTHQFLKNQLHEMGRASASLLYGGSVKPSNAAELASISEVNGFLIGGASLKANSLHEILTHYANSGL